MNIYFIWITINTIGNNEGLLFQVMTDFQLSSTKNGDETQHETRVSLLSALKRSTFYCSIGIRVFVSWQ